MTGNAADLAFGGEAEPSRPEPSAAPVSPPPPCACDPETGELCTDARRLQLLVGRGRRLAHQFGDWEALDRATAHAADHLVEHFEAVDRERAASAPNAGVATPASGEATDALEATSSPLLGPPRPRSTPRRIP